MQEYIPVDVSRLDCRTINGPADLAAGYRGRGKDVIFFLITRPRRTPASHAQIHRKIHSITEKQT